MNASLSWSQMQAPAMSASPEPAASAADPDADVLARVAAGDAHAFSILVDRHLARVHRLAWRSLGSDAEAEDVAQETFLRAFTQIPRWRAGGARFSTWLHRVALNLCHDRLRRRREEIAVDALDLVDDSAAPDRLLEHGQRRQRVEDALAKLPQRQREALLLCHFEGLSNAVAASVLEVSVDALESLLARARCGLRQRLEEERSNA